MVRTSRWRIVRISDAPRLFARAMLALSTPAQGARWPLSYSQSPQTSRFFLPVSSRGPIRAREVNKVKTHVPSNKMFAPSPSSSPSSPNRSFDLNRILASPEPIIDSSFFELRTTPFAGRSLFARDDIKGGTVIHTTPPIPFASTLLTAYKKDVCSYCFDMAPNGGQWKVKFENEKGEGLRWFCSDVCLECWKESMGEMGIEAVRKVEEGVKVAKRHRGGPYPQSRRPASEEEVKEAWQLAEYTGRQIVRQVKEAQQKGEGKAGRKARTQAIKLVRPLDLEEDDEEDMLRFFLDGILSRAKSLELVPDEQKRESWEDVRSLVSSLSPYIESVNGLSNLHSHIRLYHFLLLHLPIDILPYCSPETIVTIVTRDAGNSFGIWEPLGTGGKGGPLVGYATYPSASYFNHSCRPTVAKERRRNIWHFRTLEGGALKGQELCISYLGGEEEELDHVARREKLKVGWGFVCQCSRCREEDSQDRS